MKTLKEFMLEREYDVFNTSLIHEMVNLNKNRTKLPVVIYISDYQGVNHGPRIKVNRGYGNTWSRENFTITISSEPNVIGNTGEIKKSDIEEVKDWIKLNYIKLIKLWNGNIDIPDFLDNMKQL